ncbi:phage portal protein [Bacillus cereus]|nr:phage portal protein [Bacillus cereus]
MANPFRWRKSSNSNNEKDYFSTAFFVSKPLAVIKEADALKIPTVKSAVELISSSIAQLPIYMYVEHDDSSIEKIADSRTSILNHEANDFDASQVIKKKIVADYLLHGRAYLYKDEKDKLHHFPASKVQEENYTQDSITVAKREYVYQGLSTVTLQEHQVIVIDSGTNGLLVDSGQLFSTALEQLNYQQSLMQNGATPTGILKSASRLTQTAIDRLRESWTALYQGAKTAGKTVILEEGLDFQQLSMSPDKLQLTESNKQMVSEIARVFNIPESMLNSAANKYASNEQNSIQFLQGTLAPILTAIESAFDKKLLTQVEKDLGYFFRFDVSELLRTTEKEKIETVTKALKDGVLSFNEARAKLDLPKVEKDYWLLSIGNVLKYETGDLENLNLGPQEDKKNQEGQPTNE